MYKCKKCGMEFDLWSSAYLLVHVCEDGTFKPCQDTTGSPFKFHKSCQIKGDIKNIEEKISGDLKRLEELKNQLENL
jgi:hypothetical protein